MAQEQKHLVRPAEPLINNAQATPKVTQALTNRPFPSRACIWQSGLLAETRNPDAISVDCNAPCDTVSTGSTYSGCYDLLIAHLSRPIGSGSVERAHKVVVEPGLKGAGRHWAPDHVNPMVAGRTAVCSDHCNEVGFDNHFHL
jgi:hypothetical protein